MIVDDVGVFGGEPEQSLAAPAEQDGRLRLLLRLRPEGGAGEVVELAGERRLLLRPQAGDRGQRLVEHAQARS